MLQYSPRIVTDGLVMCLDASNNKSYPAADLPVKGGLILWLDAADDTTFSYSSGAVVSQWRDKSGLNNHVAQSTVASQPNRNVVKNSRKSVYFDGGDTLFNSGNVFPSNTTDYTKIAVVYQTSTATTGNVISSNTDLGGGVNHAFFFNGSTNIRLYHGSTFVTSTVSLSINTIGIITGTFTYSSGDGAIYVNGSAAGTGTTANKTIPRDISIGSYVGGNNYTGEICEVLVFSRVLSAIELKQVHTYLGQKWGISNTDRSIIDLAGNDDNGLLGNGTVANMPVYDYYNKGLKFNSTNANYVKVGVNSSLRVNTVTIAAFFKTITNGQTTQFIGGYGDTGFYGYWLGMSGGPMVFSVGNSTSNLQLSSTITPNNDQIYYVVGTYDGVTQRIYVDGVLKNSGTTVTGVLSYSLLTDGFLVGQIQGFSSTRYMTGSIYAMQVYNRALTAAEVAQNYEAMKSRFANTIVQQGLVLNLDASNPYSYAGAGATWYDVSGNSYNGTLSGGPTYSTTNGGILNLDGLDDHCFSTVASIPASSTVAIWIKSSAYSGNKIPISIDGDSYGSGPNIYFSESKINWNTGDGAANAFTNSSYPDSNWHYIIVTNDSSTNAKLYIDGTLIGTASYRSTLSTVTSNFWIGKFHAGGYEIAASIGQVQLYNRVLSATEVLQNYNATKGRFGL